MANHSGALSLLAAGMCLGFFVASFILLGHYERQTGKAFSQADPNWRFHSIFGALMLCISVQCLAYGLYTKSAGVFATGVINELLSGENSFVWLCFAFGTIPTPVLMLELIYSRAYQQIGFTRFYEDNARRWPWLGNEIARLRSMGASPVRPQLRDIKLWFNWLRLQTIYLFRFLLVWQFIYFWVSLANVVGGGHFRLDKQTLIKAPKSLRKSQLWLDWFVGLTVAISLSAMFLVFLIVINIEALWLRKFGVFLFIVYLLHIVGGFVIAQLPSSATEKAGNKSRNADTQIATLFMGAMLAASVADWVLQSNAKGFLGVPRLTWVGGYLPLVLTALAVYLATLFIDEWNTASVRYQTEVQRSIGGNFRDQILHTFNNKLNAPIGLLEQIDGYLKKDFLHTPEGLAALQDQSAAAAEAMRDFQNFFDDFKTGARLESTPQVHQLDVLLQKHSTVLPHNVRVTVIITKRQTFFLNVEERAFDQTLHNLVENAHFALINAGILHPFIRITVRYSVGSELPLVIEVQDNGPGIAKDIEGKLFEMHFTTKAKGTGIGLYQAKDFMERLGGSIELSSPPLREKHGTVFTLRFPQQVVSVIERTVLKYRGR